MNKQVRKAVIPVAGFGTRLLPVTKSVPKELLPLVDTPAIQVIVEECIASGIDEVVLVTGRGKGNIEDHFDYNFELEAALEARGKLADLESVRNIGHMVRTIAVRQKKPLGLGHAILCARDAIGDEPFLVLLPDDIIVAKTPVTRQMLDVYDQFGTAVVSVMEVPKHQVNRYGIVAGESWAEGLHRIRTLVEKPDPSFAPSNLAIIGRYLLPPVIFDYLSETKIGADGEIQLTDALGRLARERALIGYAFQGRRYDLGDKLGFIKANLAFALSRPDMREELLAYLREHLDGGQL